MYGPQYTTHRDRPIRIQAAPGLTLGCSDYQMRGLTSGTRIATATGWRAVETVAVGDRVQTFDNGVQAVVAVTRSSQSVDADTTPAFAEPIDVPAGALGNDEPMVLLPEQAVMIESDAAEALTGDPFALVPAKALVGFRGIERFRAVRAYEVVTLHFANDEVIYVEGGALCLAQAAVPADATTEDIPHPPTRYEAKNGKDAAALVAAMIAEDSRTSRQHAAYAAAA